MARAVRFDEYGGIDVLKVVEVPRPVPGPAQVVVQVKAAGINPGEASIRRGLLADRWPATFPSGEGSDLAGVVAEVGDGVDAFAVGDEVLGFTHNRASHADFVLVEAANLTARPAGVSWEAAGALFVAGTTAYAAVRAVSAGPGDIVVVSGAAGGWDRSPSSSAAAAAARVIGLASPENHPWLAAKGVIPVTYGDGVADRIRDASGGRVDAFIDTFGSGYVELAISLGVRPDRIDTIIDYGAAEKFGVKTAGNADGASAAVLSELAGMISAGRLEIPIARAYPLDEVRAAYQELERRHTRGKIALIPAG